MPLTNTACKNAKPAKKPYKLFDGGGLYLEVMPTGARYWRLKYRLGKEKRLAIGVYPQISLADARESAAEAKRLISENLDPVLVKRQKKHLAVLKAENSFEAVAREWYAKRQGMWSASNRRKVLNRFTNDIFPYIGSMPVDNVTAPVLLHVVRVVEKRGAHEIAHRVLQYSGQVFRYAIATGRADRDPSRDLKDALQPYKSKHYVTLGYKDLPKLFSDIEKSRMEIQSRLALRLLILTFVRTSELINAKWSELDLKAKMWEIPPERMKMRRPHLVPLSKQAMAILKELKTMSSEKEHVFPGKYKPRQPMSNATIINALHDMGYKKRQTGHGFRALAMTTIKEKLKYRHEVVERQLAHAPKTRVVAAYDRAEFIEERTRMMQDWADFIDAVVKKPAPKK